MFKGLSDTRLAIVILALIATAIWHWWTGSWPG